MVVGRQRLIMSQLDLFLDAIRLIPVIRKNVIHLPTVINLPTTRMHSSRMRTAPFSDSGGESAQRSLDADPL